MMTERTDKKESEDPMDSVTGPIDLGALSEVLQVLTILATLGLCVGYGYARVYDQIDLIRHIVFGIGIAGFGLSFILIRIPGQIGAGVGLLGGIGALITLVPAYYEGGVSSPYVVWFIIIPLLLGILVSPRTALWGGVLGALLLGVLGVLGDWDLLPSSEAGNASHFMLSLNIVMATAFSSSLGFLLGRLLLRTNRRIRNSHNAELARATELADSQAMVLASFRACPDAIVVVDESGRLLELNPAAESMFETDSQSAAGRFLKGAIIPPRLHASHEAGFKRFLDTGIPSIMGVKVRTAALRAEGEEFPIELVVESVLVSGDQHFIGYIRDVTEREDLESRLHDQQKQLTQSRRLESIGRLASGIAHDFNNLLMAINGYSELLLETSGLDAEGEESLKEIRAAGLRATSLTRQLLAFSRSVDGERFETVAPNDIITGLTGLLSHSLPSAVKFVTDIVDDTWQVKVRAVHFEQTILNMILNAGEAMPEGGRLTVQTTNVQVSYLDRSPMPLDEADRGVGSHSPKDAALWNVELDHAGHGWVKNLKPGEYSCVMVTDTGTGMDQETLDKIFVPFFSTKGADKGTGLGLSMAQETVEEFGGLIAVASTLGEGTTFAIFLPRSESETEAAPAGEKPHKRIGNDQTILVVEDEETVRRLICRTLTRKGFQVIEATNGNEGYEQFLLNENQIQLILTDIVMPKLSGVQMVRRIRVKNPDIKVVFVSGHPESEILDSDLIPNRSIFIPKPFQLDRLVSSISQMLIEDPAED